MNGRSRRLDLAYPEVKVAIEYDGAHHYRDDVQRRHDHVRLEELRADGWLIIVVVARDIFHEPAHTVDRVAEALRSRGIRTRPGDNWRPYFQEFATAA